jgi:hypothetical protein
VVLNPEISPEISKVSAMDSNEEIAPRPLPSWLSIPIILLCLGGGGWIIHWYVMTDSLTDESHLLGDVPAMPAQQQQGGRRGGGFGGNWVREMPNGRYAIRGSIATAVASLGDGKHNVRLNYNNYQGDFPGNDIKTVDAARLIVESRDKARITAMKLTESQIQQLHGLAQMPEAVITTPQREAILTAFQNYRAAKGDKRQEATDKLRQLVDETATQAMPATKPQIAERAKKIDLIITPDKWKIDADMGGGK